VLGVPKAAAFWFSGNTGRTPDDQAIQKLGSSPIIFASIANWAVRNANNSSFSHLKAGCVDSYH
jgi:hypothetical protein